MTSLRPGSASKKPRTCLTTGASLLGIARRDLELDRLADRRAGIGHAGLDQDAGEIGGAAADLGHDLLAGRARLPVGELEQDQADHVLVDVLAAAPSSAVRA